MICFSQKSLNSIKFWKSLIFWRIFQLERPMVTAYQNQQEYLYILKRVDHKPMPNISASSCNKYQNILASLVIWIQFCWLVLVKLCFSQLIIKFVFIHIFFPFWPSAIQNVSFRIKLSFKVFVPFKQIFFFRQALIRRNYSWR